MRKLIIAGLTAGALALAPMALAETIETPIGSLTVEGDPTSGSGRINADGNAGNPDPSDGYINAEGDANTQEGDICANDNGSRPNDGDDTNGIEDDGTATCISAVTDQIPAP